MVARVVPVLLALLKKLPERAYHENVQCPKDACGRQRLDYFNPESFGSQEVTGEFFA
jgi:hypothetical protein